MPLLSFSQRLLGARGLVVGAHLRGEIAVEVEAAQQRRMAVDRAALEGGELGEAAGIAGEQAGKVHEFGEAEHLGVMREGQQVVDFEPRAGRLQVRRRHAARKLHAQVHRQVGAESRK